MRIKVIHIYAKRLVVAAMLIGAAFTVSADRVSSRDFSPSHQPKQSGEEFTPVFGDDKPERKVPGLILHRASSIDAADQLTAAKAKENNGDRSSACSGYDRLVRSFPYSSEAAEAQLRLGKLYEKMGEYKKAFAAYHYLLVYYPETAPVDATLQQMYAIADHFKAAGKTKVALDHFSQITKVAPQWRFTAQTLIQVGLMHFERKDYYKAADAFDTVTANHPGTLEAKIATEQHALTLYQLSLKYKNDETIQIRAIALVTAALRDGDVNSANRDTLVHCLNDLNARRAERFYQMSKFYDTKRYDKATKIAAYSDFIRRFPATEQAKAAKQRLTEL